MARQIKKPSGKLIQNTKPHKIQDDNQSIRNGVINEKPNACVRGAVSCDGKCK
jgi:hypothetical protein